MTPPPLIKIRNCRRQSRQSRQSRCVLALSVVCSSLLCAYLEHASSFLRLRAASDSNLASGPGSRQDLDAVADLVARALGHWKSVGIDDRLFARALNETVKLTHRSACFVVQYLDGELFTLRPPDERAAFPGPLYRSRRQNIIDLLSTSLDDSVNNFEAIFCLDDCIVSQNRSVDVAPLRSGLLLEDPLPIFTVVSCVGSCNIPFPTWDVATGAFDSWDKRVMEIKNNALDISWDKRHRKAVFRGAQ